MEYTVCNVDIKEVQKVQLEMVLVLDRLCKKHKIPYQLYSGTLLGAIRHNGFIPWDDDLDVCMLRADYTRFLDVCRFDLDAKYFCQTFETDKKYLLQFAKLRKNNTTFIENSVASEKIHHGIYIDIFPFDNIEPDSFKGKFQKRVYYILNKLTLIRSKSIVNMAQNPLKKFVRTFVRGCVLILPKGPMDKLQRSVAEMLNYKETEYVTDIVSGADNATYNNYKVKRKDFNNLIDWEFEGHALPIPKNYDAVLKSNFGNYMEFPPVEDRQPHHNIIELDFDN